MPLPKVNSTWIFAMLLMLSIQSYAQTKNRIGVAYGFASNGYYYIPTLTGDVSISGKGSTQFGINYFRNITDSFSIETGLVYMSDKVQFISYSTGVDGPPHMYNAKVLSVPIYANLTFAKYLFFNGGMMANMDLSETNYSSIDNQSGIGLGIGIGGKYTVKSFTISVNPFLKTGPIIPFQKDNSQGRLAQSGINFGLSYNF